MHFHPMHKRPLAAWGDPTVGEDPRGCKQRGMTIVPCQYKIRLEEITNSACKANSIIQHRYHPLLQEFHELNNP